VGASSFYKIYNFYKEPLVNNLSVPRPGWISAKLMPAGSAIGLAMLGVAVTMEDGMASDDQINAWYARIAVDDDPIWEINQHYVALEAAYPFLVGFLGPLTAWTEYPQVEQADLVRSAAQMLSEIAWSHTEPAAGGDILGRVHNDMNAIGARRSEVFDYTPIDLQAIAAIAQGLDPDLRSFMDAWCGSGIRVIGLAKALRIIGGDPAQVRWHLNDPSPMAIALAGLNMVGYQIGPDVTLRCDRRWAEIWAANRGSDPLVLHGLPKELAEEIEADVPALERKR
jgi:hypothetical protein